LRCLPPIDESRAILRLSVNTGDVLAIASLWKNHVTLSAGDVRNEAIHDKAIAISFAATFCAQIFRSWE
jgi:hypothetical protein